MRLKIGCLIQNQGVLGLRIADYIYCEDDLRDIVKILSFKTTKQNLHGVS